MTKKSSKKSFEKLFQSSTILLYIDKRYLFKKKMNKRFSHITMAQERALKDTNTTNMASPINFY